MVMRNKRNVVEYEVWIRIALLSFLMNGQTAGMLELFAMKRSSVPFWITVRSGKGQMSWM